MGPCKVCQQWSRARLPVACAILAVAWTTLQVQAAHAATHAAAGGSPVLQMFGNDAQRTGRSLQPGPISDTVIAMWTFPAAGAVTAGAVIDASGALYFGDAGGVMYGVQRSGPTSVIQRWSTTLDGPITASAALSNNGRYVLHKIVAHTCNGRVGNRLL